MYIFSGDKILIYKNNFNLNPENCEFHVINNVINNSKDLPEVWQKLPSWLDVEIPKLFSQDYELISIREVWHRFGHENFLKIGGAWQFANWFRNYKYCSCCGGKLSASQNDFGRICETCGKTFYAPLSPAIIVAITRDGKLLLAHNANFSNNRFSIIAGFVEPGESLEMTVQREILEEVNIHVKNIKYFGRQPWPFPNSLMLGFTAEWESGEITPDGTEIVNADWYSKQEISDLNIPDGASIARRLINNYLENY